MTIVSSLLRRRISLQKKIPKVRKKDGHRLQSKVLKKLLSKAEFTAFGEEYKFSETLAKKDLISTFRTTVPVHDYNKIFSKWWYRTLNGEPYVTWPGKVKYFALSSGTSEASSKQIPVTKQMLKSIQRTSVRQLLALANYDFPKSLLDKGILMIGGSTHLNFNGTYFEGDLSGITTGNIPFWFQHFYKPGKRISREREWSVKIEEIVNNAPLWDIGIICGVPAWIQILLEKIIEKYQVSSIHAIWPNLQIYVHGGVSFNPYRKGFDSLLSKPLLYLETYLASEGFIAFDARPGADGMKLVLDNGIFYEFVPFTRQNFDEDGNLLENPKALTLQEVQLDTEYALLISTCAGAWRYLLGDTIKFTSLEHFEIIITGRTKHFLSLCGEHLSQDNMNRAMQEVSDKLNINVKEFSVCGAKHDTLFAHKWFIGTNDEVDKDQFRNLLDEKLKSLNDDYRVERSAALKEVMIDIIPPHCFIDWMREQGREGGQNKFPRVLKGERLESWEKFVLDAK